MGLDDIKITMASVRDQSTSQNSSTRGRILRVKMPSKRFGSILVGVIAQVPATIMLLGQIFDMHNRFSALLSIVLPYAAIADRLSHPPFALMLVVVIVTLVQYPTVRSRHRPTVDEGPASIGARGYRVDSCGRQRPRDLHETRKGLKCSGGL